jgi:localization factor PodJL
VALFFTFPGGSDDGVNRPGAGESIGEILNGKEAAPAVVPQPGPAAEFAPPSAPDAAAASGTSLSAEANGLGTAAPPTEFMSGTSMLPGGSAAEAEVAKLEAAALRGDASAQFRLALLYTEGRGVVKDDTKALSLATKAAEQGLVVAQYRLGAMYERGIGVPKDLPQAKNWYERAAKGGNRKAMHNLAVLYADGVGLPQSFQTAAGWFRQGADYGLADSQYNLAILLERGMGVEKNMSEAAKWYAIASSQGDTGATERLEALKKTLSANDVAMALEAARRFKPKALDPVANEMPAFGGG